MGGVEGKLYRDRTQSGVQMSGWKEKAGWRAPDRGEANAPLPFLPFPGLPSLP